MILRILGLLALVWGVVVLAIFLLQTRIAFPGPNSPDRSPADAGMPDGRRVTLMTSDSVRLTGWYLPPNPAPSGPAAAVIWFYGNMETIADLAPAIRWLRPPGIALLIVDYRGYGQSAGRPTEAGLYRDAEAAWAFLTAQPELDATRIGVYGRSLGSAPALFLAVERPVRAVALDSPFSSGRDMARSHYPFVPTALVRLELPNVARAARLSVPLLVLHGTNDRIAPIRMGEAVAQAGRGELIRVEGSGHNEIYDVGGDMYRERLWRFWREKLGG